MQKNNNATEKRIKSRKKTLCKKWLDRAEKRLLSDDFLTNRHGFLALNMAMLTFLQFSEKNALSFLVDNGYLQDSEKRCKLNAEAMYFLLKVEPFSKVLDKWWNAEELAKERASLSPEEIRIAKYLGEIPE